MPHHGALPRTRALLSPVARSHRHDPGQRGPVAVDRLDTDAGRFQRDGIAFTQRIGADQPHGIEPRASLSHRIHLFSAFSPA